MKPLTEIKEVVIVEIRKFLAQSAFYTMLWRPAFQRSIEEDIMRIKHLTLSIVMLAVISPNVPCGCSLGQSRGKLIKVEKVWDGEIKFELRQQAPQNGFIANEKAWAELWRAYRGDDELPKIDFDKQMILVGVGYDPNGIGYDPNGLILNENGDLKVSSVSNFIVSAFAPETCRYVFLLISREGVKTINGKPVQKDSILSHMEATRKLLSSLLLR